MAHFLFLARATSGRLLSPQAVGRIARDLSAEWRIPAEIDRHWDESGTEQLLLINAKGGVLVDGNRFVLGAARPPGPGAAEVAARDANEPRSLAIERGPDRLLIHMPGCASRRIWWAVTADGVLVVTTLQRLAVACLGAFHPNDLATGWVLSTGALGPDHGWDRRMAWLAPGCQLSVERSGWRIRLTAPPPLRLPEQDQEDPEAGSRLRAVLEAAAARVPPQPGHFLTLSGGIDCRVLALLLLRAHADFDVPSITWGCGPAPLDPTEDSHIAARLAVELGLDHSYAQIDGLIESTPFDDFLPRFVRAGEGAVDHMSGYFDNFRLFEYLVAKDLRVNLRADEVFGGPQTVYSEFHVRALHNFLTLDDIANCRSAPFADIRRQDLGSYIAREPGESLENLRDRIYLLYRVPVTMAGLAELKSPFIEVLNPFLTEATVQVCRGFSPGQRTGKKLFHQTMADLLPDLPIASKGSNPADSRLWSMRGAAAYARERFGAPETSTLLPEALLRHLHALVEAQPRPAPRSWRDRLRWLKPYLPDRLLGAAKRGQSEMYLSNQTLILRALIICEAEALMGDWAKKRLLA